MGSLLYLSKGKFSSFLLPSPPDIQTCPGKMAWMKFKWNQAASYLISKRIITLEGNLGRGSSLHWDSSDVLLSSVCSWASFNLYFLLCSLWMKLVPGDDLTTGMSWGRNSHLFSNLSSEAIKNQEWLIQSEWNMLILNAKRFFHSLCCLTYTNKEELRVFSIILSRALGDCIQEMLCVFSGV